MQPDLKSQWSSLFPLADEVGELIAVLRKAYSLCDQIFGQSEGSRALWLSLMAAVVTGAALVHPRVEARARRWMEISAHLALQLVMLVLVGGPWLVFPILNQCVIKGKFLLLSLTLVSTAFVSGWGTHCNPEGQSLSATVNAVVGWISVDPKAFWIGMVTFSLMTFSVVGSYM